MPAATPGELDHVKAYYRALTVQLRHPTPPEKESKR